jgi:hypothetical protein
MIKKIGFFVVLAAIIAAFGGCQKEELTDRQLTDEVQPQEVVRPDVYMENEYLVFKTKEVFDSIRFVIEKLSFEECIEWEKSLDFTSAKTEKYIAEEEALRIANDEGIQDFKAKYSQCFDINEDLDINYKFYATGLEDILNIKGLVKIENSLYKFSEDKEYIVLNGDYNMISEIESGLKSGIVENENVVVFEPTSTNNKLKSTDVLDEGIKTVGIRRLIWSVEKYVFSTIVNFDPYTGLPTY